MLGVSNFTSIYLIHCSLNINIRLNIHNKCLNNFIPIGRHGLWRESTMIRNPQNIVQQKVIYPKQTISSTEHSKLIPFQARLQQPLQYRFSAQKYHPKAILAHLPWLLQTRKLNPSIINNFPYASVDTICVSTASYNNFNAIALFNQFKNPNLRYHFFYSTFQKKKIIKQIYIPSKT